MTDTPSEGFILYHRNLKKHHIRCHPILFSYWIHCLESAAWKDHQVWWNGEEYTLKRGSFITSAARDMADLGVSRHDIRRSQRVLRRCKMITTKPTNRGTLVEVCKYSEWQDWKKITNQLTNQEVTSKQPASNQQTTSKQPQQKERKEIKEGKRKRITTDAPAYSDEFENFWNEYPKREDKAEAWELFKEIGLNEQLLNFAKKYAAEFKGTRKQYAKKAKYMLRNQEWLSWMNGNKPAPAPNSTKRSREQDQLAKARGCTDFSFYRAIIKASHPNLNPEMISKAWDLSLHYKTIIEDPNHANHQHRPTQN